MPEARTHLEIAPPDPGWPRRFERERDRIASALGPLALRIEHCGSTAVPGLAARPVIDVQVSVAGLQPLARYTRPLEEIGYSHHPHADDAFAPFFHRPARWPHTHHLHLVEAGGEEERRALAPRFAADRFETRQAYADAKGDFVAEVTALALAAQRRDPGGA